MYPYLFMVLVVIIYAGNILVGKALNDLPPLTIAFFRLFIAFLILLPIGFKSFLKHRTTFWNYKKPFLVLTLTGITLFNTFIYSALQYTTATNVSVLESSIPVLTVILSAIILQERLYTIQKIGVILSFLGAVWVILDGKLLQLATVDWNIGDGIMIGAVLSWAIYSIYVKQYMHLFPTFAALFVMTGISVILLFPAVALEWFIQGVPTFNIPNHIVGLLFLGIFPSFIALILYNRSVELLGPSKASVFLNFLPIFTMIGAYLWLGEKITMTQIFGAFIVIGGVILATQLRTEQRSSMKRSESG